jgi:hypothetical protein
VKRYNLWPYYDCVQSEEDSHGEWVRFDDAERELAKQDHHHETERDKLFTSLERHRLDAQRFREENAALIGEMAKLRAVLDALPRCGCGKVATQIGCAENDPAFRAFCCDAHYWWVLSAKDLPYADALRALEKA